MSEKPKITYITKPGSGQMFKNKFKVAGDKTPDFKGEIVTPDGEKLEIAAWITAPQNGGPNFFSMKCQPEYKKSTETADDVLGTSTPQADTGTVTPATSVDAPADDLPY